MEIEVLYFDNDKYQVESRYIISEFMGRATADDRLVIFEDRL